MNPSSSKDWSNPPPPGTEYSDGELEPLAISPSRTTDYIPRAIDRIDPYLKSPEYIAYERKIVLEEPRHRSSRSASRGRYKRRKSRSRSRSRHRHRRSRSRSRRRRRHYSSSRSRSRSKSRSRTRDKHRERRHKRSRSRRSHKSKSKRSRSPRVKDELRSKDPHRRRDEEDDDEDDDEETEPVKENAFKNDGSFLEMFKKMQEEKKEEKADTSEIKKPLLPPAFGKRRGGKVLKTGLVEKARMENDDEDESAQDAWSVYMKEVRRYKEACCDDDSKTRPLVK